MNAKPFGVYSKQLSSVADFINGLPFTRDAECCTMNEARSIALRLEKIHPSRHYFAGVNVGQEYQPKPANAIDLLC